MLHNKKHLVSTAAAFIGAIVILVTTGSVQGEITNVAPPLNDDGHIGLTPSEIEAIAKLPKTPPVQKEQTPEQKSFQELDQQALEKAMYGDDLIEWSTAGDGQLYWSGAAMENMRRALVGTLDDWDKVGRVTYPGLHKIRVILRYSDAGEQALRKDMIKAANRISKKAPEINQIEFYIHKINASQQTWSEKGVVSTTRKDIEAIADELSDDAAVLESLKKHFDVSQLAEEIWH